MSHTRILLVVGALASAFVLSGCAGSTTTPGAVPSLDGPGLGTDAEVAQFDELYKAAIDADENQVVIYGRMDEVVMATFEQRFPGIDVVNQDLVGAERDAKLAAEASSGNRIGDIATDGQDGIGRLADAGACAPVEPIPDVPSEWIDFDSTAFGHGVSVFGIVYNTELVDEADVPTSWNDLLDPQWQGKIVTVDPTLAGRLTMKMFGQMLIPQANADALGMPFLESLETQQLNTVATDPLMVQSVSTGESVLAMPVVLSIYLTAKGSGAPVGISFPLESDNQWTLSSMCKLEGAPHSKAAELYMNWLYSPEGQATKAKTGLFPVMPGTESPLGLPALSDIDLIEKLPTLEGFAEYPDAERQVAELFGR